MESTSTAAWAGPYELQLAMNWTGEEEAPADDAQQVWAPTVGHPALQYSSIVDIFGSSCSLQPYVVTASTSTILLDGYNYYAAAAAEHHDKTGKRTTTTTHEDLPSFEQQMEGYMNSPMKLFQQRKKDFEDAYNAQFMKRKMHRYPPCIRALDDDGLYTVPRVVAIGPYHHYGGGHLKQAEDVKHAAACHCITESGRSVQEMYAAVISAMNDSNARGLYHTDVMEGLDDRCFLPMMFFDACFLVMYILKMSGAEYFDETLFDFFTSNDGDIFHDIMLLENQIPLQVVDAVLNMCTADPIMEVMKKFSASCKDGCLQDWVVPPGSTHVDWDEDYYNKAPHLLGLFRFYIVGKRRSKGKVSPSDSKKLGSIQISASAIELAQVGIFLTANTTTELQDIGLARKCIFLNELSMMPLSLKDTNASLLVNMAALELCRTSDFFDDQQAEYEDSAVCSYLLLLSMSVHKEEDVHELRTRGILQGAGLTNKKTLDFFTSLQSLRYGRCYGDVMVQIARYKMNRPWIKMYAFCYRNRNIIAWACSAIAGFIALSTTLIKLKGAH